MSGAPDNYEIDKRLAVLEERMTTHQAEYKTDIAQLAESIAQRDARLADRLADRDVEAARRETRMLLAITGIIGLAVTIAGLLF